MPPIAASSSSKLPTRSVPDAPADAGGLSIEGKSDGAGKLVNLVPRARAERRRRRDASFAEHLFHRGLVAAEKSRPGGGAGNPAGLADVRRGEDVSLDRGLEPVDGEPRLEPLDPLDDDGLVAYVRHLLVVGEPVPKPLVERVLGALADAGHRRADVMERPGELPLVGGESRLDQNDVHGG